MHLLDMVWASLGSLGDELSEQEWKLPTEVPGWSVQDNLAHITGIESSLLGRAAPKHEIAGDLVRDLLPFRIFDSWVHEQDMRRAVQRPGDLDSPVAEVAFERIAGTMPYLIGKKAGAPEGSTIVFELAAPLAKTLAIGVDGGRATRLDAPPASPTVLISTDTETFCRLATGRMEPADALTDGRLRIEGDEAIGQRVVEQLNFLF